MNAIIFGAIRPGMNRNEADFRNLGHCRSENVFWDQFTLAWASFEKMTSTENFAQTGLAQYGNFFQNQFDPVLNFFRKRPFFDEENNFDILKSFLIRSSKM